MNANQDYETILNIAKDAVSNSKFDYCSISNFGQFIKDKGITLKPKDFQSQTWSKALSKFNELEVFWIDKNSKKDTAVFKLKS